MRKILIVDDDPDIVMSMKVVLEDKGYQVIEAENGEEGLKKCAELQPDVIILDIMMGDGKDGFEVARTLKKDVKSQNIPILMLTAIKEKMGLDFKKEAGDEVWLPVNGYCEKPLNPKDLIEKVEALLNKSHS